MINIFNMLKIFLDREGVLIVYCSYSYDKREE